MQKRNLCFSIRVLSLHVFCVACMLCSAWHASAAPTESNTNVKLKILSADERSAFLNKRGVGSMLGSFNSYASLLYAVDDLAIGTTSKEVASSEMRTIFPKFYKPTWAERFEAIARLSNSSWKYDEKTGVWMFAPPELPLPYTIKVADGWREKEHRSNEIGYFPSVAPVGMDIDLVGTYSGLDSDAEKRVAEFQAMQYAVLVNPAAKLSDMHTASVDGVKALTYQTEMLGEHHGLWRQWSFVKNGRAFVIVSAIDTANESKLWPDVQKMVASFHVLN